MDNKIDSKIIQMFAHAYRIPSVDALSRDTVIAEALSGNSMDMIGLIGMLENEFDFVIPLADAMKVETIGEMIDKVNESLNDA